MRRREFIGLVAGAAAWPMTARAQQSAVPVIAVLGGAGNDADGQARVKFFSDALQSLGRIDGRNIRLDVRLLGDDLVRIRTSAAELARSNPAAILAIGTPSLVALREATRTIPLLFANVSDPVDGGFVDSEAHPGGNITGFTTFEYSVAGKWLELLKEVNPKIATVLVLLNPSNYTSRGLLRSIQAAAPSAGVQVTAARVSIANEIAPAIIDFARRPNGAIIVTPDALTQVNLSHIATLSTQHRLPSVFALRTFVANGGLLSYGTDLADIYRGVATYADRILKGEKPSDLPVQNPTKYKISINLRTAKAIGLAIPESFLLRADEVIE